MKVTVRLGEKEVTVRLNDETEARLRRFVKEKGGSVSDFVRTAIAEKVEREIANATPGRLGKQPDRRGPGRRDKP